MKVLLASDWYPPVINGVVTSVLTLRAQLVARGHDVRTLTLAPQVRTTRDEFGYHLASVGAGAIYEDARVGVPPSRRVLEEVAGWGPDVVHSQAEFTTFAWSRRIREASDAVHVHTYHTMYEDYTHYFSPSRRLGRLAAGAFTRRVLENTDRVVAPTRKVAALLGSYRVSAPVRVVPTGIDVHALRPWAGDERRTRERWALRARLGYRQDEPVLLYVGRLAREKELDRVLRLVARYRAAHPAPAAHTAPAAHPAHFTNPAEAGPRGAADPAPRLLVVGDGPEREHLHREARRLGLGAAVTFAGAVAREDIGAWYGAGDVFVSASRSETQGLTCGEALACGLPVLVAADPCLDGFVGEGRGGWQFATDEEFPVLLAGVLGDRARRAEAAESARRIAVERCSAESFGARIEKIYEEALACRPRHRAPVRPRGGPAARREPRLELPFGAPRPALGVRPAALLGAGRR